MTNFSKQQDLIVPSHVIFDAVEQAFDGSAVEQPRWIGSIRELQPEIEWVEKAIDILEEFQQIFHVRAQEHKQDDAGSGWSQWDAEYVDSVDKSSEPYQEIYEIVSKHRSIMVRHLAMGEAVSSFLHDGMNVQGQNRTARVRRWKELVHGCWQAEASEQSIGRVLDFLQWAANLTLLREKGHFQNPLRDKVERLVREEDLGMARRQSIREARCWSEDWLDWIDMEPHRA